MAAGGSAPTKASKGSVSATKIGAPAPPRDGLWWLKTTVAKIAAVCTLFGAAFGGVTVAVINNEAAAAQQEQTTANAEQNQRDNIECDDVYRDVWTGVKADLELGKDPAALLDRALSEGVYLTADERAVCASWRQETEDAIAKFSPVSAVVEEPKADATESARPEILSPSTVLPAGGTSNGAGGGT